MQGSNDSDRHPMNLVNSVGVSVTDDSCYIHTGEIDGNAWSSELYPSSNTHIDFELPQVYFVTQIQIWNFMSWLPSQKSDNICGLRVSPKLSDCTDSIQTYKVINNE